MSGIFGRPGTAGKRGRLNAVTSGDVVLIILCIFIMFICLLPLLTVVARSISTPEALMRNEVFLLPVGLNLESYSYVLSDPTYLWALAWTAILTVIGVIVSMVMTTLCAYPLTYPELKGRKLISSLIVFTMFFNAGTIPTYLLLKDLRLLNKPAVLIIPYCLNVFYMIIMRTFLQNIPASLRESAEMPFRQRNPCWKPLLLGICP